MTKPPNNDDLQPFIPSMDSSPVVEHSRQDQARRRTATLNSMNAFGSLTFGGYAVLSAGTKQPPEILLQAVIIPGQNTNEGTLVEAVAFPWFEILDLIEKDAEAIY